MLTHLRETVGPTVKRAVRRPTARDRRLPDFLVLGAQKAGTTALFEHLERNDLVAPCATKEVHYFDHTAGRSVTHYRSNFARTSHPLPVGEASPYYLLHPRVPERAHDLLPDARLVAILRNPADRAHSHFVHSRAYGKETETSFDRALDLEAERTDAAWDRLVEHGGRESAVEWFSYVRRGLYAEQLERWLAVYPREQLHVLLFDDLLARPRESVEAVARHIGVTRELDLPDEVRAANVRTYDAMGEQTRARLEQTFRPDTERLEHLLGRSTGWAQG